MDGVYSTFFSLDSPQSSSLLPELLAHILPLPPMLLRVLRVVRILLRILRLLKGAKELRNLIVTMILSFPVTRKRLPPSLIVTFVYAVVGVDLFAYLAHGEMIDGQRNFETLGSASLLLYQVLTGDAWSGLMADAMLDEASGLCTSENGDCGSWLAIPYFISFQIIGSFVILNLVVAVILEHFASLGSQNPELVTASDVEAFKEVWAIFDPDADNKISAHDLPALVLSVPPPLGRKGVHPPSLAKKAAERMCLQLKMPQSNGLVKMNDVLAALTRHNFYQKVDSSTVDAVEVPIDKEEQAPAPSSAAVKPLDTGARRCPLLQGTTRSRRSVVSLRSTLYAGSRISSRNEWPPSSSRSRR